MFKVRGYQGLKESCGGSIVMFLLEWPTKNDVEELGFRELRRRGAILEQCRGSDQGLYGENSREIKKNREAEGEGWILSRFYG
jgi:hypothetical protein